MKSYLKVIISISVVIAVLITLGIIFYFIPVIPEIISYILTQGLVNTLLLTGLGLLFGFFLGMLLAIMRVYGAKELNWLAIAYEKVMRGIPLLVLIFLVVFGFPGLFWYFDPYPLLKIFSGVVLALALRSAAYQSQIFRGAILSVDPGQMAAAKSVGMNGFQGFRYVVMPQALRLAIPGWSNEYAVVIKDTSFAFGVGIVEMTKAAYDFGIAFQQYWALSLGVAAILYFVFTFPITKFFVDWQTRKLKKLGLGGG